MVLLKNTLVYKEELENTEAVLILNDLIDHIKKSMINKVNKIRVTFTANKSNFPDKLVSFLTKCDFELEAVLEKEVGNLDFYMYTRKYINSI